MRLATDLQSLEQALNVSFGLSGLSPLLVECLQVLDGQECSFARALNRRVLAFVLLDDVKV